MRITMVHTFWMRVTSLVPRVMSEAAENRLISASEKATTRANRRRRKSRPIWLPVPGRHEAGRHLEHHGAGGGEPA